MNQLIIDDLTTFARFSSAGHRRPKTFIIM
jgi:hypothetical protein